MRIGIDARFYGSTSKGLGRYTERLIKHLEILDEKNEYTVFLRNDNIGEYIPTNLRFTKAIADFKWYTLREQLEFPKLLNRYSFDLVHFPHFNVPLFYNGKYIVTIHDLILTHYPTQRATTLDPFVYFFKHQAYSVVIRHAITHAQKVLAVSHYTQRDIAQHFNITSDRLEVITEGVDLLRGHVSQSFRAELLARHRITLPYLLYVGNVYPHKNLERYLEAFRKIVQRNPKLLLVIVGRDDYFFLRLKKLVTDKGLASSVRFPGFVSDEELAALYESAELFVFPSLYEGFGLPPLEAMAAGTPVIASNATSIPEVLGDAAHYFDPEDIHDMIQITEGVLSDPILRNALRRKGLQRILRFSWEDMARRTLAAYTKSI